MDGRLIVLAVAVVLVVAAILLIHNNGSPQSSAKPPVSTPVQPHASSPQSQSGSNAILFNSTPYAQYAYLISSPTLSQQAQSALAGFKLVRTTLQNGSVEMNISLSGSGQGNSVTLAPGYKMYLVEATFGDDGYGFDSSLGDDGFVIVNTTGYVV